MQRALHDAAFLGALDQPGRLEHCEVLHEAGQRHVVRLRQLGDVGIPAGEGLEHMAARPVGERREQRVELVV